MDEERGINQSQFDKSATQGAISAAMMTGGRRNA
jgi:hypothetical protein